MHLIGIVHIVYSMSINIHNPEKPNIITIQSERRLSSSGSMELGSEAAVSKP